MNSKKAYKNIFSLISNKRIQRKVVKLFFSHIKFNSNAQCRESYMKVNVYARLVRTKIDTTSLRKQCGDLIAKVIKM